MKSLILFFLLFCFHNMKGQNKFWKDNVIIRKAFESKDNKAKPASFFINWPKDEGRFYLVNAGVAISFDKISHNDDGNSQRLAPSFFYVRNRNNQIDKEQNNHKAGLSLDFKRGWYRIDTVKGITTRSYLKSTSTLQYLRNAIPNDTSNSFIGTTYVTWLRKWKAFVLNDYNDLGSSGLQIYIGPSAGFEYQRKINAQQEALNGSIFRLYFNGVLKIAFKQKNPRTGLRQTGTKIAELSFDYAGRKELSNTSLTKEEYTNLFITEFTVFPFARSVKDDISFGISFNKGQDPIAGLEKQQYWQLAIKFKK